MSQQVLDRSDDAKGQAATLAKFGELTASDRCDAPVVSGRTGVVTRGSCGAQAFVRVVLKSGHDLTFCGHCIGEQVVSTDRKAGRTAQVALERRRALEAQGATFYSTYGGINLKPTSSAPQSRGF